MPQLAHNVTYVPFCICLDLSGSMSMHSNAINRFIRSFREAIKRRSVPTMRFEVYTITFGNGYKGEPIEFHDFESVTDFQYKSLEANERTTLGRAVNMAIETLEDRKEYHKSNGHDYKQPVLLIVSDGHDNDDADVLLRVQEKARQKVLPSDGKSDGKLTVVPVMFHGANERILRDFSPRNEPTMWTGWTEEKFSELVRLINASREQPDEGDLESILKGIIKRILDGVTPVDNLD